MTTSFGLAPLALEAGLWFGWVETPPQAPSLAASPILVTQVEQLKTGAGLLRLRFIQPLMPCAQGRRDLVLKMLSNHGSHLVASYREEDATRTVVISDLDLNWLRSYCPELLARRSPSQALFLVDDAPLAASSLANYIARIFGAGEDEIASGAHARSFGCAEVAFPSKKAVFSVDRTFDPLDAALIARGFIPQEMEEKWFVYLENERLIFKRSWTGIVIYRVEAVWRGRTLYLGQAEVNRRADQYQETDSEYDRMLLDFLISDLLLGLPSTFPVKRSE
jgi:hypothetical protein